MSRGLNKMSEQATQTSEGRQFKAETTTQSTSEIKGAFMFKEGRDKGEAGRN